MGQTLELEHCGVVDKFSIDFSAGPGVYELTGSKGQGKTTVIKSVELLIGRKVTLTVTDGELSGEVRGFGVVAPIGGKRRRRGKLEVAALESDTNFTIEDLIDPPIKDPVAADKHRIKALVSLRGTVAEPADYYDLVGGKASLEKLLSQEELKTDDPILLSARVKEAVERKAREQESIADTWSGHAQQCLDAAKDVDITVIHDSNKLQAAYDDAKATQIAVFEQIKAAVDDHRKREEAKAELEKAKAAASGLVKVDEAQASVYHAENEITRYKRRVEDSEVAVAAAMKVLAEEKSNLDKATAYRESAAKTLEAAKAHQQSLDQWEKSLAVPSVEMPPEGEQQKVTAAVAAAKSALEHGVIVRQAITNLEQAKAHTKQASDAKDLAIRYREQARGVMDVLTQCVDCPSIRVESVEGEPRLVVDHPKRGKTLFCQLSDGERVRHVIDAVVVRLPDNGLSIFPLPQRTWQDLPPKDRLEIRDYCKSRGVIMIAARVTDGPLHCEYYSGS